MFNRLVKAVCYLAVVFSSFASADAVVSAEELARGDLKNNYYAVAKSMGVTFYDGPYDGERPVIACEYSNIVGCVTYTGLQLGVNVFDLLAPASDQEVENYIFYHAVRNVYAGVFYHNNDQPEHVALLKKIGIPALTQIEIMRLKSGQQPLTLFKNSSGVSSLIERVKEVY